MPAKINFRSGPRFDQPKTPHIFALHNCQCYTKPQIPTPTITNNEVKQVTTSVVLMVVTDVANYSLC